MTKKRIRAQFLRGSDTVFELFIKFIMIAYHKWEIAGERRIESTNCVSGSAVRRYVNSKSLNQ